jgi:hypothetical protein
MGVYRHQHWHLLEKEQKMRISPRFNATYAFAAAVICTLLLSSAAAQQSNASQLLEQTRSVSAQLNRDVVQMESFTRSKVSWETHATQINTIKAHINNAGKLVGQLEDARGSAAQWQRDAIDRITPLLKEMASNTEAIINHLNKAKRVWDPPYQEYLKANHELSDELTKAIGDFVDYGNTREKLETLEKKLETS